MLYPLIFKKVFVEKIWGGRAFEKELDFQLPVNKLIGESWEVSAHSHGMSIIENGTLAGKTLQEVLTEYKDALVGSKIYKEYGDRFPLLIKYLDVNEKISIQVHPDDEYGLKYENELGKSECWYILAASDDAKVILGMQDDVTKEEFLRKVNINDFEGLFEEKKVKKGDFFNIPPGTVHTAIAGKILLIEIEENSDITYRIYDFDREENGVKRELHLDKSAEVINFENKVNIESGLLSEDENRRKLVTTKYYTVDIVKTGIEKMKDISNNSFIIYIILNGNGQIKSKNGNLKFCQGDSLLIPNGIEVEIPENLEFLRITI